MSIFKQKIAKYSYVLEKDKEYFKKSIEKVSHLRTFSTEVHLLIKLLINGYKSYGKRHKTEFESLEDYRKTISPRIGLSKILFSVSSYTKLIGEFYTNECEEKIEALQSKQNEFNFEIENFNLSSKLRTYKIIEEISKSLQEINEIEKKVEELIRHKEEIKIILANLEVNPVKADLKMEKVHQETELGLSKEITSLTGKVEGIENNLQMKISKLKEEFIMFTDKSFEIETKCADTIETFVSYLSGILVKLLEFRKRTSEILNSTLENISIQDSDQQSVQSPKSEEEMVRISNQKIEILNKIKEILIKVADSESHIPQDFLKQVKKIKFSSPHSDLPSAFYSQLEDIQESLKIQQKAADEIHASIIKPIETLIRIQTSLNSSLQLSLKNISKNFKKAAEHYLNSPSRQSLPASLKAEIIPVKVLQFKENQSKQINSLLIDHVNKENTYLSSVKNALSLIHENNSKVFEEVNELLSNSNISLKSINLNTSFYDLSDVDKKYNKEVAVLKKNGRNDFKLESIKEITSDDEEFRKRFDKDCKEPVVASFLCAYIDGILLQGKMYITASLVAFYSHFNNSTIIGRETVITIPVLSIEKINKLRTAFIFDNSLSILTDKQEFFFTSFISRDEAFQILSKLISLHEKRVQRLHNPVFLTLEGRKPRLLISGLMKSVSDPFVSMFPNSYFSVDVFDPVIQTQAAIEKVYQLLYSDSTSFYKTYLESTGDEVVELTQWSTTPPDFYLGSAGANWSKTATRTIKTRHKLKERLPLMPTHCILIENQTIYFFSQEKFVIEADFEVNAPYGEYFTTYLRTTVEKIQDFVQISLKYGMVFNSYTIFQSKIIREGTKETIETLNGIWKPMALKTLAAGNVAEVDRNEANKITQVQELEKARSAQVTNLNYLLWAVIVVLILFIIRLWNRVKSLEIELSKLKI